ncbi:MAG TPA: amidohydrolase family protein [Bacteroidota bacterium]
MNKVVILVLLLAAFTISNAQPINNSTSTRAYAFVNGRWFDGQSFKAGTFYSVGGLLTSKKPAHIDSTLDLKGKFVVPPLGEAHNHNVEPSRIDAVVTTYLESGIYYVKNANNVARFTIPIRQKINIPTSIDAVFSNGGLTSSGGHPIQIAQRMIDRNMWTVADGEGGFYYTIDNQADLDRKWSTVKASKPDFIKTYLLYSEEYPKRKGDTTYAQWWGLDPVLLPIIVARAHRDGLSVSTHIESAHDFHVAVEAGVDEINHMPGFRPEKEDLKMYNDLSRYEISETDASLAGRRGTRVVTTLGTSIDYLGRVEPGSPMHTMAEKVKALFVRNLQLLHKNGVRVAIGSDNYRGTSLQEALHLYKLKAFDNATLLKLWCENTPLTIFPNRKIGRLNDGYEASFLVLAANPLDDFTNVQKIEMRVKQGEILKVHPQPSGTK